MYVVVNQLLLQLVIRMHRRTNLTCQEKANDINRSFTSSGGSDFLDEQLFFVKPTTKVYHQVGSKFYHSSFRKRQRGQGVSLFYCANVKHDFFKHLFRGFRVSRMKNVCADK